MGYLRGRFSRIINSYVEGSVSSSTTRTTGVHTSSVGVLAGISDDGGFANNYSAGSVSATASTIRVGGLIGRINTGVITNNSSSASVSSRIVTGDYMISSAGGLIGRLEHEPKKYHRQK